MLINPLMTINYEHKTPLCPSAKQTQSKPISLTTLSEEFCSDSSPAVGITIIYFTKSLLQNNISLKILLIDRITGALV